MRNNLVNQQYINRAIDLLQESRRQLAREVNSTMTQTYYQIGRIIIEEEQNGNNRADYGKAVLKTLSNSLTEEFGRGFSIRNVGQMRKFYLTYAKPQTLSAVFEKQLKPPLNIESKTNNTECLSNKTLEKRIPQTVSAVFELSWSHYLKLMLIDDSNEREFYEKESTENNWSVRELTRQINSAFYTRLILSKDSSSFNVPGSKKTKIKPIDIIKDPYILEFIGLAEKASYSESDLEQGIIDKLEQFLLELGTGFTFVARQKRISFSEKHFHIDLVFYNRILNSFVLVDLKIGELKHQDIGQMQMYVNYYDRKIKLKSENNTIGIILCQTKCDAVVEYTLPENNKQIFASKYRTILPSREDLKSILKND